MTTENNNQEVAESPEAPAEEGTPESIQEAPSADVDELKSELQKRDETIGSLKREMKDLKKSLEKPKETSQKTEQSSDKLEHLEKQLQKLTLAQQGINSDKEIELAERLKEETGMDWDKLVTSKYFKSELEELRAEEANAKATSGVKGDGSKGDAKQTVDYWVAKGTPPSREQVPDRKMRAQIARAFLKNASTGGKTFYND